MCDNADQGSNGRTNEKKDGKAADVVKVDGCALQDPIRQKRDADVEVRPATDHFRPEGPESDGVAEEDRGEVAKVGQDDQIQPFEGDFFADDL